MKCLLLHVGAQSNSWDYSSYPLHASIHFCCQPLEDICTHFPGLPQGVVTYMSPVEAFATDVIKIYTSRKYGHPGVPIFTRFWGPCCDYRNPLLLVTGSMVRVDTDGSYGSSRRIKCKWVSIYKVAKSGRESISLKEIENGRSREKLIQASEFHTGKWVSSEKMHLFQGKKYQVHLSSTPVQSNDGRGGHAWWDDLGRCKTCLNWEDTGLWTVLITGFLISHSQTRFWMGSGYARPVVSMPSSSDSS